MIRTLLALIPGDRRGRVWLYTALTVFSVLLRAIGVVLLVPLVAALFSDTPADAWPWLGWLTALTVTGWLIDTTTARLGFDIGFAVLDGTQHDMADRLPNIKLDWLTQENTATTRQAIAATGPELVGLVVNLLTPLIGAVLLPAAIAVALLVVSVPLGLAAFAGVVILLGALWLAGRLSRTADGLLQRRTRLSPNASSSSPALSRRCARRAGSNRRAAWSARRCRPSTAPVCGC